MTRKDIWQAAAEGEFDTVKSFIDNGLDANIQNENGWTPLHFAARYGHVDVVRALLDSDKSLAQAPDVTGGVALHYAAMNGHDDVCRMLLLADPSTVSKPDTAGCKPLHYAVKHDHLATIHALVEGGADLHETSKADGGLLHVAAGNNSAKACRYLINQGVDKECVNGQGKTPIHIAAALDHDLIIVHLVLADVDVNAVSHAGETPLHLAARENKIKAIKCLLENGADEDVRNTEGKKPVHHIVHRGDADGLAILLQRSKSKEALNDELWPAMPLAASAGHSNTVFTLVEIGCDVNAQDQKGNAALHYLSQMGDRDGVQKLLERSSLDSNLKNTADETAADIAEKNGRDDIKMMILKHVRDNRRYQNNMMLRKYVRARRHAPGR